jgi:hypothetical protein
MSEQHMGGCVILLDGLGLLGCTHTRHIAAVDEKKQPSGLNNTSLVFLLLRRAGRRRRRSCSRRKKRRIHSFFHFSLQLQLPTLQHRERFIETERQRRRKRRRRRKGTCFFLDRSFWALGKAWGFEEEEELMKRKLDRSSLLPS